MGYYGHPGYYGYGGYYRGYYGLGGYGYGLWGRKKREADPAVLASSSSAPVVPLTYGLGHPLVYGHGLLGAAHPGLVTVEHKGAEVTPGAVEVKSVTAPVVYGYGLGGYYGLPVLAAPAAAEEPAAVEARKKREAEPEAEADPEAWYYSHYGGYYGGLYGYGYGLGYGGYYGYPYAYYGR